MAQLTRKLLLIMGMNHQGDLGPITAYTSAKRNRLVFFTRSPPLSPASPEQRQRRDLWRSIAMVWRTKSTSQRANWNQIAIKCRLRVHGYALFIAITQSNDNAALNTLCARCGISPLYL